jgi:flagellar biosynthesis protein FliR
MLFFLGYSRFVYVRVAAIVSLFPFISAAALEARAFEALASLTTGICYDGSVSAPWRRAEYAVAEALLEEEVFSKAIAWGEFLSKQPR